MTVIGQEIVKKLFPSENPLGKTIKMEGRTYVIIGTFADKGTSFGQSQDNIAIIPITRFYRRLGRRSPHHQYRHRGAQSSPL